MTDLGKSLQSIKTDVQSWNCKDSCNSSTGLGPLGLPCCWALYCV